MPELIDPREYLDERERASRRVRLPQADPVAATLDRMERKRRADPYVDLYRTRRTQAAKQPRPNYDGLSLLERTMREDRDNEIKFGIMDAPAPDQIARETRVARAAGTAPAMVGDVDYAEKAINGRRLTEVFGRYPALGHWGAANLRGAATAQDDHEALGAIGKAYEVLKGRGQQFVQTVGAMGWGNVQQVNELGDTLAYPLEAALATVARPFGINIDPDKRRERDRVLRTQRTTATSTAIARADERATTGNYWLDQATGAIPSLGASMIGVAMGVAARNPGAASTILSAGVSGQAYGDARAKGLGGGSAAVYSFTQGATEKLTEMLPLGGLVDAAVKKLPAGKTFIRQLAQEIPGEQVATIIQDMADWVYLPENADKTLGDYLAARPEAGLSTLIQTGAGTTAQTGITIAAARSMRAAGKLSERVVQTRQARREAQFIDRLEKVASTSKFHARDPEGFGGMIASLGEDAGATHIYIDGAALAAYAQTDAYEAG